jgi:hypothetical protein
MGKFRTAKGLAFQASGGHKRRQRRFERSESGGLARNEDSYEGNVLLRLGSFVFLPLSFLSWGRPPRPPGLASLGASYVSDLWASPSYESQ